MERRRVLSEAIVLCVIAFCGLSVQSCTAGTGSPIVATGSVHCSGVTGSVGFVPPLDQSGGSNEKITVTAALSHCFAKGSNVSSVTGGIATSAILAATNACSGLLQFPSSIGGVSTPLSSRMVRVDTRWRPSSIGSTSATFSGFAVTTDDGGYPGFAFPGVGHRARVTGSFGGGDRGALSTAVVFTNERAGELLADCSRSSGLGSIKITSGEVTFY